MAEQAGADFELANETSSSSPTLDIGHWTLDSHLRRSPMRIQPLDLGKLCQRGQRLPERCGRILDDAGAALKLVHRQPGKAGASAASGQRVARTGDVIAQNSRGIWAEADCARRDNSSGPLL